MQEKQQTPLRKVSVEDLLQLKRHERPSPEFWNQFDRQLREKQLRALVKREPWYVRWVAAVSTRLNPAVPVTAAAVMVMAMFLPEQRQQADATTYATGSSAVASRRATYGETFQSAQSEQSGLPQDAATLYARQELAMPVVNTPSYTKVPAAETMSLSADNVRFVSSSLDTESYAARSNGHVY